MGVPEVKKVSVVGEFGGFRWRTCGLRVGNLAAVRKESSQSGTGGGLDSRALHEVAAAVDSCLRLFTTDAALFDLVEEGLIADAELLGGAASIPMYLS
jgi:hypothetical protein